MKLYLVVDSAAYTDAGVGDEVVAAYTDRGLAVDAASHSLTTDIKSIDVSDQPAQVVQELTLVGAVRIGPDVPVRFNGDPTYLRGEIVTETRPVVDYRVPRPAVETLSRFHCYGWGPSGGGVRATFLRVETRGIDHADVRAKFAAALADAKKQGVTV